MIIAVHLRISRSSHSSFRLLTSCVLAAARNLNTKGDAGNQAECTESSGEKKKSMRWCGNSHISNVKISDKT